MKVSDLFSAEVEPALKEWMGKFTSPGDLFLAMPQLYEKVTIADEGIVEDGAVLSGPVHISSGAAVHAQAIICGPSVVGAIPSSIVMP